MTRHLEPLRAATRPADPAGAPRASLRSRAKAMLGAPAAARRSMLLALPLFGLWSLWLGQDANWDLLNYHVYNPYAFLQGRLGTDLAAAQLQSYFNPLLDLPYYAMVRAWPAPAAGFVLGAWHGLNFVLLLYIARRTLGSAAGWRDGCALLLAAAGCLGPAFLSEIGNTMGDNTTAPLVLGALALLLHRWPQLGKGDAAALGWAAVAGLLAGLASGLKLTNALYAVALCLALLGVPAPPQRRIALAFAFGLGTLAGLAAAAGSWFALVWQVFGNPLFPQFNAWFQAELAMPISVADTRWLPHSAAEALLFPFVIAAQTQRVSEVGMRPLVWPVLWLLAAWWAVAALRRQPAAWSSPMARFVVVFVGLAFVTWMAVFSIYRYAVGMELLAPLAAWLLLHRLAREGPQGTVRARARKVLAAALALAAAVAVLGFPTWGRAGWHTEAFRVEVPPLPPAGTLLLVGGQPQSWMVPFFPPGLAVAGVATNFPAAPAFHERVRQIVARHGGQAWALLPAAVDRNELRAQRLNGMLEPMALPASGRACKALGWLLQRARVRAALDTSQQSAHCRLAVLPAVRIDTGAAEQKSARWAGEAVAGYGFALDLGSCRTHNAYVGTTARPYQLCAARLAGP